MLQFRGLDRLAPPPTRLSDDDDVGTAGNETVEALRRHRHDRAAAAGPLWRALEAFDSRLRTTTLERLDRPEISDDRKLGIVEALHGLNVRLLSYWRFLNAAAPMIRRINTHEGRPARIVELAAGYGELTLRAPAMAKRLGLDLEITGTDIVPAYVERGRREAQRRGVAVTFETLDAFRMDVSPGRFDLALIAQSMHHFSAGGLATMISACRGKVTTGFVGVDGHRSLLLLWFVPAYALAFGGQARLDFAHDALLSGRKFFTESELLRIGQLAAPDAAVTARTSHPGYSVLTVDFARRTEAAAS
jgi:hypothetical protein